MDAGAGRGDAKSPAAQQPCCTSAASVGGEGDDYAKEQHLEARQPPSIDCDHGSQRPDRPPTAWRGDLFGDGATPFLAASAVPDHA